jgi:hypothetical protein
LPQSIFRSLACAGLLLFQAGCVDRPEADTGKAILYVYDGTSQNVLSWENVSDLFDAGSAGAATRTLTSNKMTGLSLGWAGMALDSFNQYLYLVSSSGTVVRISRIGNQDGAVPSADVISFTLDDTGTDAVSGGVFGQVAVNPVGNLLYITENNPGSGKSQLWVIPSGLMADGVTLTKDSGGGLIFGNTGIAGGTSDKNCTGVAASSSAVFGYFDTGGAINPSGTDYAGARLRKGTTRGVFPAYSSVIVGQNGNTVTLLGKYGCLAYDTGNDLLYVARHSNDSGLSGNPLLVFTQGKFSPGLEAGPESLLGPADLRVIAHAGRRDWLVGARSGASNSLWIWKGPSSGDTSVSFALPDTGSGAVRIYGLALDGSQ